MKPVAKTRPASAAFAHPTGIGANPPVITRGGQTHNSVSANNGGRKGGVR